MSIAASACIGTPADTANRSSSEGTVTTGGLASTLNGTLVQPPLPLPTGTFRDTQGQPVPFTTSTTSVTVLFFGFTNCDDVCPTTMADLAVAKRLMPSGLASRLSVRFVTVDPVRDQPRQLRRWLARIDPDFVGLRAGRQVVNAAERALFATASEVAETPKAVPSAASATESPHAQRGGGYQVNHTGTVYVFGPGNRSVIYTGGTTPREYAADFTRLLSNAPKF